MKLDGNYTVGFICGINEGTVTECAAYGAVRGGDLIGGICGYNFAEISKCKNEADVSSYEYDCAGICSVNEGTIEDCYNTGDVVAKAICGGVASENFNELVRCYNDGNVAGMSYVGSICGYNEGTGLADCYYLEGTAKDAKKTVQGGVGSENEGSVTADKAGVTNKLTEDLMSAPSSYEGFDFKYVWIEARSEGYVYPELRAQLPPPNGDVNNDGEINSKDSNLMKRFIAGETVSMDEYNADIQNDASIDAKDSNVFKRIIAGTV